MKVIHGICCAICVAVLSQLLPLNAFAADGWEATLTVSVRQAKNKLNFGQRPDATDGIDGKYDAPAMLAGGVKASFIASEGSSYWRDIMALSGTGGKIWKLHIEAAARDTVYLRWKSEALPKNRTVYLTNGSVRINMTEVSEYSYLNEKAADFQIEVGDE